MNNLFYVYEHWRPDRDECFYVGKGRRRRANSMATRNSHHKAIQEKLARLGSAVEVRIIAQSLKEQDALALEIERIAFWRNDGADLANHTDGGEGVSGFRLTEEQRKKISEIHKGKRKSAEHRLKIGMSNKGKIISDEARSRMRAAQKNSKVPYEKKVQIAIALGKAQKGRVRSEETRKRMAEAAKAAHARRRKRLLGQE